MVSPVNDPKYDMSEDVKEKEVKTNKKGSGETLSFNHNALWEKPLTKWHLGYVSLSRNYKNFLCISLSFLIVDPLIL